MWRNKIGTENLNILKINKEKRKSKTNEKKRERGKEKKHEVTDENIDPESSIMGGRSRSVWLRDS